MPTQISGTTGVDKHQDGSVTQADLAANVAGNGPAFKAVRTTDQSITSGVATTLDLETTLFDTDGIVDLTANRITPTIAGYYAIYADIRGTGSANPTAMSCIIRKNGSTEFDAFLNVPSNFTTLGRIVCSGVVYCNGTTDYIEVAGFVTASSGTSIQGRISGFLARAA